MYVSNGFMIDSMHGLHTFLARATHATQWCHNVTEDLGDKRRQPARERV